MTADIEDTKAKAIGKRSKEIELIEVNGKRVSKTSTGKRKFHKKSKTGCDNCKRRRVKCDEGKPGCKKCSNLNLVCVYSTVVDNKVAKKTTSRKGKSPGANSLENSDDNTRRSVSPQLSQSTPDTKVNTELSGVSDKNSLVQSPVLPNISNTPLSAEALLNGKLGNIALQLQEHANIAASETAYPTTVNNTHGQANSTAKIVQEQRRLLEQLSPSLNLLTPERNSVSSPGATTGTESNLLSQILAGLFGQQQTAAGVSSNTQQQQQQQPLQQLLQHLQPPVMQQNGLQQPSNYRERLPSISMDLNGSPGLQYNTPSTTNNATTNTLLNSILASTLNPISLGKGSTSAVQANSSDGLMGATSTRNEDSIGNALPFSTDAISQLTKLNLNSFPTAGIGGISYDFHELFGIKYNHTNNRAIKVSSAEEALANMQEHREREQASKISEKQKQAAEQETRNSENGVINKQNSIGINASSENSVSASSVSENFLNSTSTAEQQYTNLGNDVSNLINLKDVAPLNGNDNMNMMSPLIKSSLDKSAVPENPGNDLLNTKSPSTFDGISMDMVQNQTTERKNENNNGSSGRNNSSNNISMTPLNTNTTSSGISDFAGKTASPSIPHLIELSSKTSLGLVDLKLFHHYCTEVWPTIIAVGISSPEVWGTYLPDLAFKYPFLMHSMLAFSATHLSRTQPGLDDYVASHRLSALKLLREAVLEISDDNTDALVASSLILIMDSLANASNSNPTAWIFHVKGAVTILTAVWPLPETSKFYNLISVDLSDLGEIVDKDTGTITELVCCDDDIADLYPVDLDSPYLITLAYLDKLYREKNQLDYILRVFAFPALLDRTFLTLLMTGDLGAMRIMRSYYKLLRNYTTEIMDRAWFLEGVSQVLPRDVDDYSGGGGMHMMLDFLGGGLPSMTTTNLSDFM